MSFATVYSRAALGMAAPLVTIEVHLSRGLPGFHMVGLPEAAVKESRHRVRSALMQSGFDMPPKKIIVNLAPADLPKEGGRFDLPIALGLLAADGQIDRALLSEYEFVGELALDGGLRHVRGVLSSALATHQTERHFVASIENDRELQLLHDQSIYLAENLLQVVWHLTDVNALTAIQKKTMKTADKSPDFSDVVGQKSAKRAMEIVAAGQHSALMVGPPGSGKTMLASRLPSILPALTRQAFIESRVIHSLLNQFISREFSDLPPFRSPHHSASRAAIIGGGNPPLPGEVSLAHHGVLFLDELPEFQRSVLESLREPLEVGEVNISRAANQINYPANFQLIAAMNPCPCGYYGSERCRCREDQVEKYQAKLSGPLLDRIDLCLSVSPVPLEQLAQSASDEESSEVIKQRVLQSRQLQQQRQGKINAELSTHDIKKHCALSDSSAAFFMQALETLQLSARAYHRVLKVARTIADLAGSRDIQQVHLQEALGYRQW